MSSTRRQDLSSMLVFGRKALRKMYRPYHRRVEKATQRRIEEIVQWAQHCRAYQKQTTGIGYAGGQL